MNNLINHLRKNPVIVVFAGVWVFYAIFHVRLLSLGHDSAGFFQEIYEGALQKGFDFSWFHPHYALAKGIYILLLKALFLLGVSTSPNSALVALSYINITCTTGLVCVFFQLIHKKGRHSLKIAILNTGLFATSYVTWIYLTSVEVYPLSFLIGAIALIQCMDAKKLRDNPLKIGLLLGVSALFHIQNVFIGLIVLVHWIQRSITFKSFYRFFCTSTVLFLAIYFVVIKLNQPYFSFSIIEILDLFKAKSGASYSFSIKSILFSLFSVVRTFFGGIFLFSDVLKDTLLELIPLHHLYDEFFLMRNLWRGLFFPLISMTVLGSGVLLYLMSRIHYNKITINIIIFLLFNFFLGLITDPLDLDKFIFFPILLFYLIPKNRHKEMLVLGGCLLFVNYFGAMQHLKTLDNDYFYTQVKTIDQDYNSDDLVIIDFPYQYSRYINLFTSLDNVIYLTSETKESLFNKQKIALDKGKRVYIHPNVTNPTTYFINKYKTKE